MLPIGVSDFKKLIEHKNPAGEGYFFIDKTLFIKDILFDGAEVIVLSRPRRFGKTLNLSMLRYFFEPTVEKKKTIDLFSQLKISKYPECMKYQGQHPVIFITFKEAKYQDIQTLKYGLKTIISRVFDSYNYLVESDILTESEKNIFYSIVQEKANEAHFRNSLYYLSQFIFRYHGKKPYFLIDEYDIPIQQAYLVGYYDEAVDLIRSLFSAALKDNEYIEKAVLTGIVRVSKESLFSGLNNIKVYSILNDKYSQYFGFLEDEVDSFLREFSLSIDKKNIKEWYNGYKFGSSNTIYNPWSILNCIGDCKLQDYWVNTSGNELAKKQIEQSSPDMKNKIKKILQGESIKETVNEHLIFSDLDKDQASIWSLLLLTGYLKTEKIKVSEEGYLCDLSIPNKEVESFYKVTVKQWMANVLGMNWFKGLLAHLTEGKIKHFEEDLNQFILESTSFLDSGKDKQESFYHGLMLGLVAGLKDSYTIKSNRESGLGRYDVALIPNNRSKLGIIMEFKKTSKNELAKKVAKQALSQISTTSYKTELEQLGISNIIMIGMAFQEKQVVIASSVGDYV